MTMDRWKSSRIGALRRAGWMPEVPCFVLAALFVLFCPRHALSQTPSGATPAQSAPGSVSVDGRTRLILLGTGGGPGVRVERSQPASLLIVDGHRYLIDCGDGTVQRLKRARFDPSDIDGIFLTHLHLDHIGGLYAFVGLDWTL